MRTNVAPPPQLSNAIATNTLNMTPLPEPQLNAITTNALNMTPLPEPQLSNTIATNALNTLAEAATLPSMTAQRGRGRPPVKLLVVNNTDTAQNLFARHWLTLPGHGKTEAEFRKAWKALTAEDKHREETAAYYY
ncbi:hypothetical protein M378DRAFT_1053659 [Amanita muscaria Koide BX008]|uniref:Uncharacterized protein n=1 Tax=Amanita muscaria (strain Koide BX008) TaxID=946122 RepID=A0A0C2SZY2_AMAMK|nr:hypothetical protein M378DRAFT_1053659 [Amanita muscaria Koide BX008]